MSQPEMTDFFVVILPKPFPFLQSTANLHSDLLPFNQQAVDIPLLPCIFSFLILFHLDVCHSTEENICCYLRYIAT